MSKLDTLLKEIAEQWKLPAFKADPQGRFQLTLNGTWTLQVEPSLDGQSFFVYGVVGSIPEEALPRISTLALSENLFGKGTGPTSLGLHPESGQLCLFQRFPFAHTSSSSLMDALSLFVAYLSRWQERLAEALNSHDSQRRLYG